MKTFILSEEMRAAKSGFSLEGTDLEYDIPAEYPLPLETIVLEKGVPVHLRLLANCNVLERDKQIERKFPEVMPVDENLRKKVTFIDGMLMIDENVDKMPWEFLRRAGWLKSNSANRPSNCKIIYQEYDEKAIFEAEMKAEELSLKAQNMVMRLKENELKLLYGASVVSGTSLQDVQPAKMKSFLLRIAKNNPEYILDGLKEEENTIRMFVNKGIDLQVLSFVDGDDVSLYNEATSKLESIASVPIAGGIDIKIDRFVELMKDEDYADVYALLQAAVEKKESES